MKSIHRTKRKGMAQWLRAAFVLTFACNLGAAKPAGATSEKILQKLTEEVTFLEGAMHRLEEEYQEIPDATRPAKIRQYLRLAKEAFQIKDYEKCSLAVYSIIGSQKLRKTGKRAFALYLLAEALYQLNNQTTALHYFKKMLKEDDVTYLHHAASRVIEIGANTNKPKTVNKFYSLYETKVGGRVPDQVRYERGKSLFIAERDEESIKELNKLPRSSDYYIRSKYIRAASAVRAEDSDRAINLMRAIADHKPASQTDMKIVELAYMGLGRLYFDQDDLDEAINAYQFISFDSDFFTEMLYEVTWVYVRRGQLMELDEKIAELPTKERERMINAQYKKALENLRMLVDLESDSRRTPDAYVLIIITDANRRV